MSPNHRRAVRVLLSTTEGKILLFLSHFEPGSGLEPAWVYPGGGIETGETIQAAALRELKEETGLDFPAVELGKELGVLQHQMPDQRIYQTGEAHFFKLVIQNQFEPDSSGWTSDEHRDTVTHRWWSLEEILQEQPWIEPSGSIELLVQWLGQDPTSPTQS